MAISITGVSKGGSKIRGQFAQVENATLTASTIIEYQGVNPKRAGSDAAMRFESYKGFKGSVATLLSDTKATVGDLKYDLSKGLVKIVKA